MWNSLAHAEIMPGKFNVFIMKIKLSETDLILYTVCMQWEVAQLGNLSDNTIGFTTRWSLPNTSILDSATGIVQLAYCALSHCKLQTV